MKQKNPYPPKKPYKFQNEVSWHLQVDWMTQITSNCTITEENIKERVMSNFQDAPEFYTIIFLSQYLLPTT